MVKAKITTIDEEFEKARAKGAKDKLKRKKRIDYVVRREYDQVLGDAIYHHESGKKVSVPVGTKSDEDLHRKMSEYKKWKYQKDF
jgi:hypothetical protein